MHEKKFKVRKLGDGFTYCRSDDHDHLLRFHQRMAARRTTAQGKKGSHEVIPIKKGKS